MNVDAIQQLKTAEMQAVQLLQQAETELEKQRAQIPKQIEDFKAALLQQEQQQQNEIVQRVDAEFQKSYQPLSKQMEAEVTQVRNVSPEGRRQAHKTIIDKVVS